MRGILLAVAVVAVFGAATGARAADMPDFPALRGGFSDGPTRSTNWAGFYIGGQGGYTASNTNFSHATSSMVNYMERESVLAAPVSAWALLPATHGESPNFGGFMGYNWQYSDLVYGVEANYNYFTGLSNSVSDSLSRAIVNPDGENPPAGHTHTYYTTLSGGAALQVKDITTFRGRVGWAAGCFLPYMFGGVAVGRMEVSRNASVYYDKYDDYDQVVNGVTVHQRDYLGSGYNSQAEARTNSFVFGWTAGLGVEYNVMAGLFLRGEWEYVAFSPVKNISVNMNNFRAGLGYKF